MSNLEISQHADVLGVLDLISFEVGPPINPIPKEVRGAPSANHSWVRNQFVLADELATICHTQHGAQNTHCSNCSSNRRESSTEARLGVIDAERLSISIVLGVLGNILAHFFGKGLSQLFLSLQEEVDVLQ